MSATKQNPDKGAKKATGRTQKKTRNAHTSRYMTTARATGTTVMPRGVRAQPYARAENVRKKVGFTQQEFAGLLGIDQRTYSRRADDQHLRGSESLQIEMIDEILQEAERIFRDEELALNWLKSPIIGLDNKRPIDHLHSIEGYERVKDTLGKIEYGMY